MRINEIFGPVIQGEGPVIGWPSMFIRTQGCDFRCAWCDTEYALDGKGGTEYTAEEILLELTRLCPDCRVVTITGGNPAIQNLEELVMLLAQRGYFIIVETQGTALPVWIAGCDLVVVSPKPPSSNMPTDQAKLKSFLNLPQAVLKVVVFDDDDFAYAQDLHERYDGASMFLQVGTIKGQEYAERGILESLRWLSEKVLASPDMLGVTVLPQLHVLLYGNERRR